MFYNVVFKGIVHAKIKLCFPLLTLILFDAEW